MPKGIEKDQIQNSGNANKLSAQNNTAATNIYGSLVPQLQAQSTAPQGYSPTTKAAINTAGQQSAGGSMAGAVGQGALLAARTKNAGTADAAIQQSARNASQTVGKTAVGTEVADANLKNQQQQRAQGELGNIAGTDLGASLSALGLSNQALNGASATGSANPWQQAGSLYLKNAVNGINGPNA